MFHDLAVVERAADMTGKEIMTLARRPGPSLET